jgi:hypothetical protein
MRRIRRGQHRWELHTVTVDEVRQGKADATHVKVHDAMPTFLIRICVPTRAAFLGQSNGPSMASDEARRSCGNEVLSLGLCVFTTHANTHLPFLCSCRCTCHRRRSGAMRGCMPKTSGSSWCGKSSCSLCSPSVISAAERIKHPYVLCYQCGSRAVASKLLGDSACADQPASPTIVCLSNCTQWFPRAAHSCHRPRCMCSLPSFLNNFLLPHRSSSTATSYRMMRPSTTSGSSTQRSVARRRLSSRSSSDAQPDWQT